EYKMEKIELRTTRSQVEDFKESILWADIIEELNSWKEGFDRELKAIVEDAAANNPSTASVLMHLGDLNGRLKAVDYMLSIPDVFLSLLEVKKDES
ncbi:MAG: hypothetical protein KKD77_20305, partial [Gammaproteobacteria bacterium]|nr:hypothetical protein [Gammaproteobacteria bacterium]